MKKLRHSPYARHRFPAEVISYAVWLYFRFPLSLRMVEEILAARGIEVSHETVRRWAEKFGREYANRIRRRAPRPGDRWHLDEVVVRRQGFWDNRRRELTEALVHQVCHIRPLHLDEASGAV